MHRRQRLMGFIRDVFGQRQAARTAASHRLTNAELDPRLPLRTAGRDNLLPQDRGIAAEMERIQTISPKSDDRTECESEDPRPDAMAGLGEAAGESTEVAGAFMDLFLSRGMDRHSIPDRFT